MLLLVVRQEFRIHLGLRQKTHDADHGETAVVDLLRLHVLDREGAHAADDVQGIEAVVPARTSTFWLRVDGVLVIYKAS